MLTAMLASEVMARWAGQWGTVDFSQNAVEQSTGDSAGMQDAKRCQRLQQARHVASGPCSPFAGLLFMLVWAAAAQENTSEISLFAFLTSAIYQTLLLLFPTQFRHLEFSLTSSNQNGISAYPHQFPFPLVVKHPSTLCAVYVNMATEMCFKKCSVSRIQHGLWHLEVQVQDWDLSDAWKTHLSLLSSHSWGVTAGTGIGTEASPSKLETVTGFWTQITQITQIAYIDVVKTDIGSLIHNYCLHMLFSHFQFLSFQFLRSLDLKSTWPKNVAHPGRQKKSLQRQHQRRPCSPWECRS